MQLAASREVMSGSDLRLGVPGRRYGLSGSHADGRSAGRNRTIEASFSRP
jgi:hypothetical protein